MPKKRSDTPQLPSKPGDELNRIAGLVENTERSIQGTARTQLQNLAEAHRFARTLAARFLDTGVAYITPNVRNYMINYLNIDAGTFARTIAKEYDRQPIIAELIQGQNYNPMKYSWDVFNRTSLFVPKTARNNALVTGLILVAQVFDGKVDDNTILPWPVCKADSAGMWRFYFDDKEGKEIFDNWRQQCTDNPVFRVILKLPPR